MSRIYDVWAITSQFERAQIGLFKQEAFLDRLFDMRWLCTREGLYRYLLSNFDTKFSQPTPSRSKRGKAIVLEPSSIDKMCLVYVNSANKPSKVSIFSNETRKPRKMAIQQKELFGLHQKNGIYTTLYILGH